MGILASVRDTELRAERFVTQAAPLGPKNAMPPMHCSPRKRVDPHDRAYQARHDGLRLGYGCGGTLLPYRTQDDYSRQLRRQAFPSFVLENAWLRATFIPALGGRLWSLTHKPTQRELLEVNPKIRLANLAFRNAWYSGGVEWNLGPAQCHTPLTASTLFAGHCQLADGTPVLRLWEWERRLELAYQMDVWLPSDSPFLRVRFRIHNGHADTLPVYEWSNIAVEETPDTRVLAPASAAYVNTYIPGVGVSRSIAAIPLIEGRDISYPVNIRSARDYFFDVRRRQPWVTALRGDGRGLIQTSTARQVGRKLFVWGMSPGGRRWQDYLSQPGRAYIEIQAGLGKTQQESVPMPPGATWEWLEAYGMMEADPKRTHGTDWSEAWREVDGRLRTALPAKALEAELAATRRAASTPVDQVLIAGSGWGALEQARGQAGGRPSAWAPGITFPPETLGADQAPWLALLRTGAMPVRRPAESPGAFQSSPAWKRMLQRSIRTGGSDHWLGWFHLGLLAYAPNGGIAAARRAWERSVALTPNPWALRGLAVLARRETDWFEAIRLFKRARRLLPHHAELTAELLETMQLAGQYRQALDLIASLPPALRRHERVRLERAWCALGVGDAEGALKQITRGPEFAQIREGELSLSALWYRAHDLRLSRAEGRPIDFALRVRVRETCPPPYKLDMRNYEESAAVEARRDQRLDLQLAARRRRARDLERRRRAAR